MPTRYHLGTNAPATADAAGIMASFATLFAVSADVDTSDSVSGVLTWTRDTTAGSQAIYSSAFGPRNCRIIIAVHDSGTPSPSPTMVASADTYTAANILIGLADNAAGAYAGWNQAAPFSGCTFAGYYRLAPSAAISGIRAMLCSRGVVLQVANGSQVQSAHAGAVLKGVSGYQESDGYRYGVLTSGMADMASDWRTNVSKLAGNWAKNETSNGTPHWGCYAVGGTSWQTMDVANVRLSSSVDSFNFAPAVAGRVGLPVQRSSAPTYIVGTWLGVSESANGLTGQNVGIGASSGVRWSSSIATTNEQSVVFWRTYT